MKKNTIHKYELEWIRFIIDSHLELLEIQKLNDGDKFLGADTIKAGEEIIEWIDKKIKRNRKTYLVL